MGNIAFQALSLGVLGAFCVMLHYHRSQIVECLKSIFTFSLREETGPGNKRMYNRFPAIAITLGALSLGLGAVKVVSAMLSAGTVPGHGPTALLAAEAGPAISTALRSGIDSVTALFGLPSLPPLAEIPIWIPVAAVVAVSLVAVFVALIETSMLRMAGSVTLSGKFTGAVIQTKRNWMAAASLAVTPLVALWTGVNPVRDACIAYVLAGVVVAMVLMFVAHTLRGFIVQKVSVLVWFLYLCTVEIFPVCAIVVAVAKNL